MSLIPVEQLRAAHERYEQAQAAKPAFKYRPRSKAMWDARCDQTGSGSAKAKKPPSKVATEWAQRAAQAKRTVESAPLAQPAQPEPPAVTEEFRPKPKVSGKTKCLCSHSRSVHCTGDPRLHTPEGSGAGFWCTTEHCEGQTWNGIETQPCDCRAFRVSETDTPKLKRPKAGDYTPCANPACKHFRCHHCRVRRPSKAAKPKVREWEGFEVNGEPFRCKHVPTADPALPFRCTSASCAEEGCACEKFINPLARPRATKPRAPRKGKLESLAQLQLKFSALLAAQTTGEQP